MKKLFCGCLFCLLRFGRNKIEPASVEGTSPAFFFSADRGPSEEPAACRPASRLAPLRVSKGNFVHSRKKIGTKV